MTISLADLRKISTILHKQAFKPTTVYVSPEGKISPQPRVGWVAEECYMPPTVVEKAMTKK